MTSREQTESDASFAPPHFLSVLFLMPFAMVTMVNTYMMKGRRVSILTMSCFQDIFSIPWHFLILEEWDTHRSLLDMAASTAQEQGCS
jgi:hypothetical protein